MKLPACTGAVRPLPAGAVPRWRSDWAHDGPGVTPALPNECRSPGASTPYSNTKCTLFVQWCQDCCRVWDPSRGPQGREVCGWWYPCGVCFGWKW
jgi:hypothetical protein